VQTLVGCISESSTLTHVADATPQGRAIATLRKDLGERYAGGKKLSTPYSPKYCINQRQRQLRR
jgi:hypothetical protein